jgi:hypothetical protein
MNFGYNGRRKSNLTIIFSAPLIRPTAASIMRLDRLATTNDGLSSGGPRSPSGEQDSKNGVSAATITKGIERDEISDFRRSVGDFDVGRVTRFQQQSCRLH